MKKLTLALATLLCATFTFTSCSEEEVAAAFELTGAWQCEAISGTVGGINLANYGLSTDANSNVSQYTKLFSIYMVGTTTGYYCRVGDGEVAGNAVASLVGTASEGSNNKSAWDSFLSRGTYTAANGILTLTSNNGEVENFEYSVADGYLTLVSEGVDVTGGNETAANVTSVINSILSIATNGEKSISTNAGITYRYKKVGLSDLKNLFSKN